MPTLHTLGPTVVVAPHLDDAVFACGQTLSAFPGAVVVTVFAGIPDDGTPLPDWDHRAGFTDPVQAMTQRRDEDRTALTLLEARPVWLDFLDAQYGGQTAPAEIARELQDLLDEVSPETLLFPMGLFHSDHIAVHEACRLLLPAVPHVRALAYEDALYRGMPGLLQQRLMSLAQAGWRATPVRLALEGSASRKAKAVQAYASQLQAFGPGGLDDLEAPERSWQVEPVDGEGGS